MKYDPQIHHRKSIRLKGYDYSQARAYFITICCHNKISIFGTIETAAENGIDVSIRLNEFGQVAYDEWAKLPGRFPNVTLDVFQIMPNHMHGIIVLNNVGATLAVAQNNGDVNNGDVDNNVGATLAVAQNNGDVNNRAGASPAPTIGNIVGAYKSLVANGCLDLFKKSIETGVTPANEMMGKLWQRNYYEHIIRDEKAYQIISDYIINNLAKWEADKFFTNK